MITHHCSVCGNEIEEFCAEHPNAQVDSVQSGDTKESEMLARVVALVGYETREDGTTGQIVKQALKDDPNATAEGIAEIIREARTDAKEAREQT